MGEEFEGECCANLSETWFACLLYSLTILTYYTHLLYSLTILYYTILYYTIYYIILYYTILCYLYSLTIAHMGGEGDLVPTYPKPGLDAYCTYNIILTILYYTYLL